MTGAPDPFNFGCFNQVFWDVNLDFQIDPDWGIYWITTKNVVN